MTLLRGKGLGLEVVLVGRDFTEALLELEGRLAEQPGFYRGTQAVAVYGDAEPDAEQTERLRLVLETGGIILKGFTAVAVAPAAELERRRAMRPQREVALSDSARSLVADFAGARADIAQRRKRGEDSVRRADLAARPVAPVVAAPALTVVEPAPSTLYHVGTLRGGQSLQQVGNIVVVGDVNPGAELIASGDIVVFGRLGGVAHAGAQGDAAARVYALDLRATQLRIASCIAAEASDRPGAPKPEAAFVRDGRIVVAPLDKLPHLEAQGAQS
jgi:septum site-determining protein MinC